MERTWDGLATSMTDQMVAAIPPQIGQEAWDLITDDGKAQLVDCAALYVECGLIEAAGGDATVAKAALSAAIGNWETSGVIRAAGHADDFLTALKEGFVEAGSIVLTLLGAGLRGLVFGA